MINLLTDITAQCSDYALASTLNLLHIVINVLQIAAPIALVISLSVVFVRTMVNPDDKKSNKRIINVILATVICFLIPTALNIILSIIPDNFAGMDIDNCWRNAYNVDYSSTDRVVGVGLNRVDLKVNFSTILNITAQSTEGSGGSSSSGGKLTECGGVNSHGVKVKCISGSGKNIDVVNEALKYEGYPYVWGGKGPNSFDCSGFVSYVYGQKGYSIPSYTGALMTVGTEVSSLSQAKPGDLLVRHNASTGQGHVVMYIGNNQIIHAKGSQWGVVISPASEMRYDTIRRIIP